MRRSALLIFVLTLAATTPLGAAGTRARGQEFHASTLGPVPPSITRAYRVSAPGGSSERLEGYLVGATLMSYLHLHFASCPGLADAFVAACAGAR